MVIKYSIVIPAYNETHRLPATLLRIKEWMLEFSDSYEVIVVLDKSRDESQEVVEKIKQGFKELELLLQPGRLGKGAAVRRGCLKARGEIVLFMDADNSVDISELRNFITYFNNGFDMVVGVRTIQEDVSRFRRVIGLSQMLIAHLAVFIKAVPDSQCGFKSFKNDVAQKLFTKSRIDGGMIDVEIFYLAHKCGFKIFHLPVVYENKAGSVINVLRCMLYDPVDMLKIRLYDKLGYYE